jgi:hypothetical protein
MFFSTTIRLSMTSQSSKVIYASEETEALAIILGHIAGTLTAEQKIGISMKIGAESNALGDEGHEKLSDALHKIGQEVLGQKIHLNRPPSSNS